MVCRLMTLVAVATALATASAGAQSRCQSGRTAQGQCVNASLTASVQERAVILSQPRVSFLGPPLPYSQNGFADASRDRQSLSFGIDSPVPTATAVAPAPGTFIGLPANVNPANLNIAAPFTVVPGGIVVR